MKNDDSDSDGKGDYKGDYSTPKTGDERTTSAASLIIMGIGFLLLSCIFTLLRDDELGKGGDLK